LRRATFFVSLLRLSQRTWRTFVLINNSRVSERPF
jgi:hypothetical protein